MSHPVSQRRGRPRKFGRASRPVTVTLPHDVLDRLASVNADLGHAIVALAERRRRVRVRPVAAAELLPYGTHAVILVNPIKALNQLAGVQLVPVAPGRALISLDRVKTISELELEVVDALEGPRVSPAERQTLGAIVSILRRARRSRGVKLQQRTIIVLEREGRERGTRRPRSARLG